MRRIVVRVSVALVWLLVFCVVVGSGNARHARAVDSDRRVIPRASRWGVLGVVLGWGGVWLRRRRQ